jgi:hypothetical protein
MGLAKSDSAAGEHSVDRFVRRFICLGMDSLDRLIRRGEHTEECKHEWREFDPKIELPRWLDEYKWHRDEATWSQCARDWTTDRLNDPHYPKVWRTRRPNVRDHRWLPDGAAGAEGGDR